MSNYSFLDISSSSTPSCDLSCIGSAIDTISCSTSFDGKPENTYINYSEDVSTVVGSFNKNELDVSFVGELDLSWQSNQNVAYAQNTNNDDQLKNTYTIVSEEISQSLTVVESFNKNELDVSFVGELNLSLQSNENVTSPQNSNNGNEDVALPEMRLTKQIVAHALRFNQSYNAMEGVAKLMNSTPGKECVIPDTKHNIRKTVKGLFQTEFYIKCKTCSAYTATTEVETVCNTTSCRQLVNRVNSPYFVNFPIRIQLMKSINDNFDIIMSYNDQMSKPSTAIRDIHDGYTFTRIKEQFSDFFVLSLTLNTDGAKIFKSSSQSIWPLQLQQNFLPPIMRYIPKHIITASIHQGEPNMQMFFYPLLSELKKIHDEGGIVVERNGRKYRFLPLITQCSLDLPAKAKLQGMVNHNGYYACSYCLHPRIAVKAPKSNKSVVRYIQKDNVCRRTHKDFFESYRKSNSTQTHGVKHSSCMVAAIGIDLVNSYSIDYLHCVLLGVTRKQLDLFLDTKNHKEDFYLSKRKQDALNKRIMSIKSPIEIGRKPRSIFERDNFKGNELRSILLYYIRFSLDGLLHSRYVNHIQLLSSAIYILLQEKISQEDLSLAESRLIEYANLFEEFYGKHNIPINLHLLRHIGDAVRHLGPLWTQSTFAFETNNGVIVSSRSSKRDYLHQLAWKYSAKLTLDPTDKSAAADRVISIGAKAAIQISPDEMDKIDNYGFEPNSDFTFFSSINVRGTKYTSKNYKTISTIDYFARFSDGTIGAIKFFFVSTYKVYAFVESYKAVRSVDHLTEIESTKTNAIYAINEITNKLIYVAVGNQEIVASIPNKFEKT